MAIHSREFAHTAGSLSPALGRPSIGWGRGDSSVMALLRTFERALLLEYVANKENIER
jgi:hypothetical protein